MGDTRLDRLYYEIDARTTGFEDKIEKGKKTVSDFASFIEKKPVVAVGAFAAAMVSLAAVATRMASDVDTAMRRLRASIADPTTDLTALRTEIAQLSVITPRSQVELAELADTIASLGEHDPRQIGEDMKVLTLAADALGKTDVKPLADGLDQIQDGFGLTASEARKAFVQIVAITKGKIQFDDLAATLGKAGTKLASFNVDAVQAAHAMATLIDAGINSRQITTGVVEILVKASEARRAALKAADSNSEGDARALNIFANTVNATTVQSRGLIGALGDLYRAFNGNRALFDQAGLSANDYQVAQKAAAASTKDAKSEADSYEDSLRKLTISAKLNRESAGALAAVIKNELSAVLIDLGNTILPTVITVLKGFELLLSSTKRAARDAQREFSGLGDALTNYDAAEIDKRTQAQQKILNFAKSQAGRIADNPELVKSFSPDQLNQAYAALAKQLQAVDSNKIFNPGKLKEITAAMQALAKEGFERMDSAAAKSGTSVQKAGEAFTNTGAKGAELKQKLAELHQQMQDFVATVDEADDPMKGFEDRARSLREAVNKLVASLKPADQAAARAGFAAELDAIAEAGDRLRAKKIEELVQSLQATIVESTGGAIARINAQYDAFERDARKKIATLRALADAQRETDPSGAAATAKQADALEKSLLPALEKQRTALLTIEDLNKDYASQIQTVETFGKTADASFTGAAVSVADYRFAIARMKEDERLLQAIVDDITLSTNTRADAERALKEAIERRKKAEGDGNASGSTVPREDVSVVAQIGSGLQAAALNAITLANAFGFGSDKLGSMLGKVAALGKSLADISSVLAQLSKSGNSGSGSNAGSGLSSIASGIGQMVPVIGILVGVVSLAGDAVDAFGTKARKRAKELAALADQFNESLRKFGQGIADDAKPQWQRERDAVAEEIGRLIQAAGKAAGYEYANGLTMSAAGLNEWIRQLDKQIADTLQNAAATGDGLEFAKAVLFVEPLRRLVDGLKAIAPIAEEAEAALRKEREEKLAALTDDLNVRRLRAQGYTAEADAAQRHLQYQKEIKDAEDQFTGTEGLVEYLRALREVQAAEEAAAVAAAALSKSLKETNDRIAILGLQGNEALKALVDAYTTQFTQLGGLLDGIDVTAEGGLDALKTRIRGIFESLSADGITADEQQIIDALMAILGAAESAASGLETFATRTSKALNALNTDNDILGGNAAEKFGRLKKVASGLSDDLAGILSGIDLTSAAGVDAAKQKLRDLYVSLAADGISESEQPIVDLIRQILGSIGDVVDEATSNSEKARQRLRDTASQDIALNDSTGADAFKRTLEGYGDAFQKLLGSFDVTTLDGVEGATGALKTLLQGVRDGTVDLSAFAGMTQDEVIAAILELDSSLDGLGQNAQDAAKALLEAAAAQKDFTDSVTDDYLRTTGKNREADIAALQRDIETKIARAKELNLSDAIIQQIIATGKIKLKALNDKYDQQAVQDALKAYDTTSSAVPDTKKSEFIASAVTQISGQQALTITDYLASALVEQRGARIGIERMVALLGGGALAGLPPVNIPALPPGITGGNAPGGSSGGIVLIVNFNGPLTGITPAEAADQFVQQAGPALDAYLARAAGIQAKVAGKTLS
jgi:hypothetical protein